MAQKKLKPKAQVPKNAKTKKVTKKGDAITKRANKPMAPKKKEEERKLKQAISKTVNKAVEEEIRTRASSTRTQKLSQVQQAVSEHHSKTKRGGPSK